MSSNRMKEIGDWTNAVMVHPHSMYMPDGNKIGTGEINKLVTVNNYNNVMIHSSNDPFKPLTRDILARLRTLNRVYCRTYPVHQKYNTGT